MPKEKDRLTLESVLPYGLVVKRLASPAYIIYDSNNPVPKFKERYQNIDEEQNCE